MGIVAGEAMMVAVTPFPLICTVGRPKPVGCAPGHVMTTSDSGQIGQLTVVTMNPGGMVGVT